jgi:hypothetical protein
VLTLFADLTEQGLGLFGGWLVVAVIAVIVLYIVLKIVGKAISTSLRLAIIFGALLVIAGSLVALSTLLNGGKLPIP